MTPLQTSRARTRLVARVWMRAAAALALAAGLAGVPLGQASYSASQLTSQTFAPAADAFVSSSKPTTNYGGTPRLRMDKSPVLTTYVRFDVSGLVGSVTKATLQLYSRTSSSVGFDLRSVTDSTWGESTITYANAPAYASTSSVLTGSTRSGTWTTVDLTPLVTGNGTLSIALITSSMSEIDLDSRQTSHAPKLTVETVSTDVTAPTAPTNLGVTSATASSLGLLWSPSTDDTGVGGYDVFVDGSKVGSSTSTSYSFGGLTCGTTYTLGVQALDAAGNGSTVSSLDASTSACATDTQPPTAPTSLAASGATQTSVNLSWSAAGDNVGVTGYNLYSNGTKVGSATGTSYTFNGLACGTSYTLGVEARDAAGNVSARASAPGSSAACSSGTGAATAFRYAYFGDSDPSANKALGATLIDVGSRSSADALPAGLQGMVWLGDYDNSTCSWQTSDSSLSSAVTAAKGDPKVYGWFFSDEPNPYACPNAPAQHQARSNLIHSIDANTKTFIVLDSNGFSGNMTQDAIDQIPLWKGTADFIGLDPYPCLANKSCNYTFIGNTIAKADAAGIPYVGVLQAFDGTGAGEQFRQPTSTELQTMVNLWAGSHEVGSAYFAWDWPSANWYLKDHPDLQSVIQGFYAGGSSADTTPPTAPAALTTTAATATSVSLSWAAATDNVGVTVYNVYNGSTLVGTATSTSYTVGSLSCGTSYTFGVEAKDAAGNVSTRTTVGAPTGACSTADTSAPTAPTGLKSTGATTSSISISWTASTDAVGVAGYGVYRNGTLVTSATGTVYNFAGLACGTTYTLAVDAYDAAGNRSTKASLTGSTSACPDTTAPTAPGTPMITGSTTTTLALMWSTSLDNVGVAGYDLYLNGSKAGSTGGTTYTYTGLTCGTTYTLGVAAYDAAGNRSTASTLGGSTGACTTGTSDPVIVAAGDICASPTDCAPTASLIASINPTAVLTLGDNAYNTGSASDYSTNYDPNWGKYKSITKPAPGNHEYDYGNQQTGYFAYFNNPAAYYSYDVGSWHVISLNGELSASAGSAQETWLKNDLAAHSNVCTLAYWHEPRWSSGYHGGSSYFGTFWTDLYNGGADLVLNGHDHDYERFAPQNPSGSLDTAKGIREFVVGTGGASHYAFNAPTANSEVRDSTSFGVLKLTLHATSYDWRFAPISGATFSDAGAGNCH